ncbi:ethanolamine-phosphate cytidylyltransferase-like [Carica papaya]|uniref:ethanolamine-phosphate cytidylyltransferase-like n=1 Tax=Carica papaya TaxID=3649 RepID=UPI000B8C736C|nr:ethanolamine-phosphate cytidylyltransferase-like [Carica papaya]
MDSDARKIAATCLVGGVVVAVGASLMHLYINGASLPLGLGFELGWPWRRSRKKKKLVRVYMDGCFDMMHYGHCNALRHGDDPCVLPDGTDAYALAKKAGRYKQIKRTEGVSSTDIVGRMLLCVRERSVSDSHNHSSLQRQFSHGHGQKFEDGGSGSGTRVSHFLPTSRRIVQFSNGKVCIHK